MSSVIPAAFTFRFAVPAARVDAVPRKGKRLLKLTADCRLLTPQLDSDQTDSPVTVSAAWNGRGIGFAVEVTGKKHPAVSNVDRPDRTDGFQIWLQTRGTQNIHRASRYCHHFCLLPNGAGDDGLDPIVWQLPIARASDDAPKSEPEAFGVCSEQRTDGYLIEAWLPSECLHGFDPDESSHLGFYWLLKDSELGDCPMTVDVAFPFASDPSLWQVLDLTGAA
jgi:hypothetical protein